jgi:hypothetical protein
VLHDFVVLHDFMAPALFLCACVCVCVRGVYVGCWHVCIVLTCSES